jgi:hypothetical protein
MTTSKSAIEAAFNYEAAMPYVNPLMLAHSECLHAISEFEFCKVTDDGRIEVTFGGYVLSTPDEVIEVHDGYWAELEPVGDLTADGLHADYRLTEYGEVR